jgi:hypothetical protein
MKHPLLDIQKTFVMLAVLFLLTGCAQTLCLKFVDSNCQPLAGVSALWREDSAYNLLTSRRHQIGPKNLLSAEDGTITLPGVHKKWVSRFVFTHNGYETLYGIYTPEALVLGTKIKPRPLPQDRFILDDPRINIDRTNGCFRVEMVPRR